MHFIARNVRGHGSKGEERVVDVNAIATVILETFHDVTMVESGSEVAFLVEGYQQVPFATIVTEDTDFDCLSGLDREGIFRLNIGITKKQYDWFFCTPNSFPGADGSTRRHVDFSELDRIMPHPLYSGAHWVCVLNPSASTFQTVMSLLVHAYERCAGGRQDTPLSRLKAA